MINRYKNSILIIFLIAGNVFAEAMVLEIIPLKNRLVGDVIPIVRPLVTEGGTVTGMNNQLIVKTTYANLEEIKSILKNIDTAPRKLMISVKQDIDGNINLDKSGISGSHTEGDVSVSAGKSRHKDGLVISKRDSDGNEISFRNLSTRSRIEDKNVFRIETLEGSPAHINIGQSVPVGRQTSYLTPGGGIVVQDSVEYHDVTSGFYVLPRLQGNKVTLLVAPHLSKIHPDQGAVFDVQNVETTVSGKLGKWIPIGGVTQHFNDESSRNLVSTRRRGQEQRTILIKVEELP